MKNETKSESLIEEVLTRIGAMATNKILQCCDN